MSGDSGGERPPGDGSHGLPGYETIQVVGEGAQGLVVLARHLGLNRTVVIKFSRSSLLRKPEMRDRFFREARVTAKLDHPNIVRVLALHEEEGAIVYEHLSGDTLGALLRRDGPFDPLRAVELSLQAARGLGEAHKRQVLHRDIKPENLLLTTDGVLKILDFGLALSREAGQRETRAGTVLGTPAYMPPEQARGERASEAADIYALGATLRELVTGRPPYEGTSAREIVRAVIDGPPPPLATLLPGLDSEVAGAINQAMAREVSDRYAGMPAFAIALRALLHRSGRRAAATEPPRDAPDVTLRSTGRETTLSRAGRRQLRLRLAAVGLLTAIAAVGGAAFWFSSAAIDPGDARVSGPMSPEGKPARQQPAAPRLSSRGPPHPDQDVHAGGQRLTRILLEFWSRRKLTDQGLVDLLQSKLPRTVKPEERESASAALRQILDRDLELLTPVREFLPMAGRYFDSRTIPVAERRELYRLLAPLQLVDAVAHWLELPPPFDLQDLFGAFFAKAVAPPPTEGFKSAGLVAGSGRSLLGAARSVDLGARDGLKPLFAGVCCRFDTPAVVKLTVAGAPLYFMRLPAVYSVVPDYWLRDVLAYPPVAGPPVEQTLQLWNTEAAVLGHRLDPAFCPAGPVQIEVEAIWRKRPSAIDDNRIWWAWVSVPG